MDGTFRSAPTLFTQIYTVHIKLYEQFFPVLLALLPDKQEVTYRRMIQLIVAKAAALGRVFQPQIIHCDFEMAVINATAGELGIQPTGCLFHFTQSIYRHVQSIGLQVAYNTDNPAGVRRWVRRIMALPLVPPLRMQGVYQAIIAQAPQLQQTAAMHDYVFNTYINPAGALFDQNSWNVFATNNRTINMCEGFHCALNRAVSVRHPSVFRLIEVFQDIEATNERNVAQLALGAPPKKRKAKYICVDETIRQLTNNTFGGGLPNVAQVIQYVDAVAHNLWDLKH